jgi:hypothetical protein
VFLFTHGHIDVESSNIELWYHCSETTIESEICIKNQSQWTPVPRHMVIVSIVKGLEACCQGWTHLPVSQTGCGRICWTWEWMSIATVPGNRTQLDIFTYGRKLELYPPNYVQSHNIFKGILTSWNQAEIILGISKLPLQWFYIWSFIHVRFIHIL